MSLRRIVEIIKAAPDGLVTKEIAAHFPRPDDKTQSEFNSSVSRILIHMKSRGFIRSERVDGRTNRWVFISDTAPALKTQRHRRPRRNPGEPYGMHIKPREDYTKVGFSLTYTGKRRYNYGFAAMKVGDQLRRYTEEGEDHEVVRSSMASAANSFSSRREETATWKFCTQKRNHYILLERVA